MEKPHFKYRTLLFALMLLAFVARDAGSQSAPVVSKVEPPSWWAGHSINPVRVLVRGGNLQGARVTSKRPEISPSAVEVNSAGTYLFVSVDVNPRARSGDYLLEVATPLGRATIPFKIESPLDLSSNFQGITNDDVIYLIMPDRFSNGDRSTWNHQASSVSERARGHSDLVESVVRKLGRRQYLR